MAVSRLDRQPREIEHIENVGIAQLIHQCKADQIEILDRVAAFEGIERNVMLAHLLFHIAPGRKHTLAPDVFPCVRDRIQNLDAEVRHPDLIAVWEAERIAQRDVVFILDNTVELSAGIATGLLHQRQNLFHFFRIHAFFTPFSNASASNIHKQPQDSDSRVRSRTNKDKRI